MLMRGFFFLIYNRTGSCRIQQDSRKVGSVTSGHLPGSGRWTSSSFLIRTWCRQNLLGLKRPLSVLSQSNWRLSQSSRVLAHSSSPRSQCSWRRLRRSTWSAASNTPSPDTWCSSLTALTPWTTSCYRRYGGRSVLVESTAGTLCNSLSSVLQVIVQMEPAEAYEVINYIPAQNLPYSQPGSCYTLVRLPDDDPTAGRETKVLTLTPSLPL